MSVPVAAPVGGGGSASSGSASSASSVSSSSSAFGVYERAAADDADALVANIDTYLPLAFYYRDEERISHYLRRIIQTFGLAAPGGALSAQVKARWVRLLLDQLLQQAEALNMHVQIKILQTVCGLLRRGREKSLDLAQDWKSLYDYLARYHLNPSTRSIGNFSADMMYAHQTHIVRLIAKMRRYFVGGSRDEQAAAAAAAGGYGAAALSVGSAPALSAGEEILSTFIPFLSPFDNAYFKSQALLCLFFPSHVRQPVAATPGPEGSGPAASVQSLNQLFRLYTPFTDNLIDVCPLTVILNVQLYARCAKHALGVEPVAGGPELMAPFVAKHRASFFSTFLQLLELDVGNQQTHNLHRNWTNYTTLVYGTHRPARLEDLAAYFAKFVVYTLHHGQPKKDGDAEDGADLDDPMGGSADEPVKSTQTLLTSLLFTIRAYFHPSNASGKGASTLATFLQRLTEQWAKRVGREIRGEAPYPRRYYLDPHNLDFLLAVQPIAMQGLYSKSPHMVAACEGALRNLASFHPQRILPLLISNIEQSLVDVNSSHRMMSSLQVLTSQANIVFNAELNPATCGNAHYLSTLMALSLPGIDIVDPTKTSFTMTWLAILFYIVPLVDARDAGDGAANVQLPDPQSLSASQRFSLEAQRPSADSYADAVDAARSATMSFEDFSLAYVDVVVKLLDSADKFAKKDYVDQAFAKLLFKNMRSFFSALSPAIWNLVADKLVRIVMGAHYPSAQKQWGIIVHTLAVSNSEQLLAKLVPQIVKCVVVKGALSTSLAASELEWYVYLLAQAVKQAGGASACADATAAGLKSHLLLPYIEQVQQVYTLTHAHEAKPVRKVAGKLMRNLLKGLTYTYPAEWRSFSPIEDWSSIVATGQKGGGAAKGRPAWAHWTKWGSYKPRSEPYDQLPDIDGIWHVPSPEEKAAAAQLLQRNMMAPLKWIVNWCDGTEQPAPAGSAVSTESASSVGKSDSPLERSLWSLINLIRGVETVLGGIEGGEVDSNVSASGEPDLDSPYSNAGADAGVRCPLVNPKRTQPVAPLSGESVAELLALAPAAMAGASKVQSLRTHLVRLAHQALVRLRALSSGSVQVAPSTKAHVLLLKLARRLLTGYGCNERQAQQDRSHGRYSRLRLREPLSGIRNRLRPMLQGKVYAIMNTRLVDLSYNEPYTADIAALITDLHASTTSDFTKIRSKATSLLIGSLRRYPLAIDSTLVAMLSVFRNASGKVSDEALLGAMGCLCDWSMVGWISRRWDRMSKFLTTFFQYGEQARDDKVQLLVQQLFNTLFPNLGMKKVAIAPVSGPIPAACAHIVDTAKVERRNASIARYNKVLSRTYMQLVTFLHNHASGIVAVAADSSDASKEKVAHWRYALMSAAFFFSLSRVQHYSTALATLDPADRDGLISWRTYVQFFLRGTVSSLAPLRTISFLAVNKALGTHTLAARAELTAHAESKLHADVARSLQHLDTGVTSPVDPAASLSRQGSILSFTSVPDEKEQLATAFCDFLYSGWMGDTHNTVYCKYFANDTGRHAHMLPFAYFTPLSLTSPLKFPYKPLASTLHTPVEPLDPATLQAIHDFYTSNSGRNLQLLSAHLVHAHPSLAPSHDGASNERAGDGAGDQIAALATRNVLRNKLWPTTRFNKKSEAFSIVHVNLVRGLVENLPQLVTQAAEEGQQSLLQIVSDLLKKPDEADAACTAAEILCGIVLATKHMRFDVRVSIEQRVLPVLMQGLRTVQPDCLDHFGDCLRHIFTNSDPRRTAWLARTLFQEALQVLPSDDFAEENKKNATINPNILDMAQQPKAKRPISPGSASVANAMSDLMAASPAAASPSPSPSPPPPGAVMAANAAPSVQFKRLRFILPVLIECGFRGTKLGEWIVTQFKRNGYLASPWKQVREEIAWLLFILMRNEFQLYANHPAASPGGRVSAPSAALSVLSSPVHLQFIHYVRAQFDVVRQLHREDKANPAGSPRIAAMAAAVAGGSADAAAGGTMVDGAGADSSSDVDAAAEAAQVERLKDTAKHFIETVLTWFVAVQTCGDMVFTSTSYQALLPCVLWAQHHPDAELNAIARFAATGAAWISAGGSALSRDIAGDESRVVSPAQGVRRLLDAEDVPEVPSLSLMASDPKRTPLNSPSRVMDHILSTLRVTAINPNSNWHVRVAVANFLRIWVPRHSLLLSDAQLTLVESLLLDVLIVDLQIEVREAAAQAFQSFVASCFPLQLPTQQELDERLAAEADADGGGGGGGDDEGEGSVASGMVLKPHAHIVRLAERLQQLVLSTSGSASGKRLKAGAGKTRALDGSALAQRHGGILALCGLVQSHPYDVPAHLPSLLSFLAAYVEDHNQSVSASLRKFFLSFMSSHKDEWRVFQRQFTQQQIEELQSMQIAPSYFA